MLIKPAVPGTGVLAGGPVRAIMELAGVQNVITKSLGTDNAMNIVKAAAEGMGTFAGAAIDDSYLDDIRGKDCF